MIQLQGGERFTDGDFVGALECDEEAVGLLEAAGARSSLAAVYTSLGRLHRSHGAAEKALEFHQRALRLREQVGDQAGIIQSLNAIAIALGRLDRSKEALGFYERALALARETGAALIISRQLGNLGGAYIETGEYERGAAILEEVLSRGPDPWTTDRHVQLSIAYLNLRQYARALPHTEEAVRMAREKSLPEDLFIGLWNRAEAKEGLSRVEEALADAREARAVMEQLRTRLVPIDFMKRGYADRHQDLYAFVVDLLQRHGRDGEALEASEQARARAFLDLLAARGSRTIASSSPGAAPRPADSPGLAPGPAGLTTRGGPPSQVAPESPADPASPVAARTASLQEIVATARRLRSAVVSYFVAPDVTLVWTVDPAGRVRSTRVDVTARRLEELVRSTLAPTMIGDARGSGGAWGPEASPARGALELPTRGGGLLILGNAPQGAWSDLYDLLIHPVRDQLPATDGSRLTILPHGPLFQLSFAALRDKRGRYLVEKHDLHYAPSVGVLGFTARRAEAPATEPSRPLLVADPEPAPAAPGSKPLPPLPGARREVEAISGLLPSQGIVRLVGAEATKAQVRRLAPEASLLHFATHGIVRDDQPLESFLALGPWSAAEPADSRLTVQDIYDLDLRARLVVLSACRTARGRISADGIVGLTRALRAGQVEVPAPCGPVALPEDPALWAGFILVGEP